MVPKLRLAVMRDVPTMQRKEEFAGHMVPKLRLLIRLAVMKDVPIRYRCTNHVVKGGVLPK